MANDKERVIEYLLSKERKYNNNKLSIEIGRKTFEQSELSNMGESEFINQLSILETEGFITVHFRTPHRDLTYFITVELHESIISYYQNKKIKEVSNKREIIRTYIPITLSLVAIIISVVSLLKSW